MSLAVPVLSDSVPDQFVLEKMTVKRPIDDKMSSLAVPTARDVLGLDKLAKGMCLEDVESIVTHPAHYRQRYVDGTIEHIYVFELPLRYIKNNRGMLVPDPTKRYFFITLHFRKVTT